MGTSSTIRQIAARLEAEVARHGCDRASCFCADDQDVESALLPTPSRQGSRVAGVLATGGRLAIPDGLARQEAVFASSLPCY